MPNETKTAATTTAKASKIHDPMLTLQRAVAYIVLFVLCFICLFFFYVLIVNATHNNFTIQQGFDPLPRGSFGVNFFNTTHDANVPILTGLRNSLIVSAACAALSVYFSALTAYAIYAYDFKLRKYLSGASQNSSCRFAPKTAPKRGWNGSAPCSTLLYTWDKIYSEPWYAIPPNPTKPHCNA